MRHILLLCTLQLLLASAALGAVLRMNPDGGEFPHIQAALDAAQPGDSVLLAPGRYTGQGNRDLDPGGKPLALVGDSEDPARTIIDCQGSELTPHRGILFVGGEGPGFRLGNLTVTGGWAEEGGGILLRGGSAPHLSNVVVEGNTATARGGGLYCHFASPVMENCVVVGNSAGARGGGLALFQSYPTLRYCRLESNDAIDGGGIWSEQSSPELECCSVSVNRAEDAGGGIAAMAGRPILERCVLAANRAGDEGGALGLRDGGEAELTACTLSGNAAPRGGGLALGGGSTLRMNASILSYSRLGEALSLTGASVALISGSDIYGNAGGDWTGAIAEQAAGAGNFALPPRFEAPAAGDYTLRPDSPCRPENRDDALPRGAYGDVPTP